MTHCWVLFENVSCGHSLLCPVTTISPFPTLVSSHWNQMIAFSWFSISHHFSLPINSAHHREISLKTFSGYIWVARWSSVWIFWHSECCTGELCFPTFLPLISWHKLFSSSQGLSVSESWLTYDSLIFYPLPSAPHQQSLDVAGTALGLPLPRRLW